MRKLTMSAFVLNGVAAVGFITIVALGEGRMTPLDGFILSALIFGFFSALGSVWVGTPAPRIIIHAIPERRRIDRRIIDLGSPAGIERRSGIDRRVPLPTLGGMLASRPAIGDDQLRAR